MNNFEKQKQKILALMAVCDTLEEYREIETLMYQLQPPKIEFEILEWEDGKPFNQFRIFRWPLLTSKGEFMYDIDRSFGVIYHKPYDTMINLGNFDTLEEAKAACQAHHDALILSRVKHNV